MGRIKYSSNLLILQEIAMGRYEEESAGDFPRFNIELVVLHRKLSGILDVYIHVLKSNCKFKTSTGHVCET